MKKFLSPYVCSNVCSNVSPNIYVAYIKNKKSHFFASPVLVRLTYTPQDLTGTFFEHKSTSEKSMP